MSERLRTLIVDDEPAAVKRLSLLCSEIGALQLVGTANSGVAALALLADRPADLVLLDIDMPHMDGMTLARQLAASLSPPKVIFVTAHDRFALAAFEVDAVGYLLKPVDADLLARTVLRVQARIHPTPASLTAPGDETAGADGTHAIVAASATASDSSAAAPAMLPTPASPAFFWVPYRGELMRIASGRIDRAAAEGDYVRLHVGAVSYLLRSPLHKLEQALESQLAPGTFLRVHRSALIRRDHVRSLQHDGAGAWSAVTQGGVAVAIGRTYLPAVRSALGIA